MTWTEGSAKSPGDTWTRTDGVFVARTAVGVSHSGLAGQNSKPWRIFSRSGIAAGQVHHERQRTPSPRCYATAALAMASADRLWPML